MKKISIILVMLVGLALTSCDSDQGLLAGKNETNLSGVQNHYKTVLIDDCEYIVYDWNKGYGGWGFMAHKGNCSNKIHCYNQ